MRFRFNPERTPPERRGVLDWFRRGKAARSAEDAARDRLLATMDGWWAALANHADAIDDCFRRDRPFDVASFMREHLGAVDERLMWEFGPAMKGGTHRLVITPEARRHLRPMVDVLLGRAPPLPGWELYGRRPAEDLEAAEATVRGRAGGSLQGLRACVVANDAGGVDLTYWSPAGLDDEHAVATTFVGSECLLGEKTLDTFVDAIEVAREPVAGGEDVDLSALRERVDAAIERQRAALPERPIVDVVDSLSWEMLEIDAEEAPDYPDRRDLFLAKTPLPAMWQRAHSALPFASERFSRCGDVFCYVKIDGSKGLDRRGFRDKAEIEDALASALEPARLGAVIGGGTGLRYSYVDLALRDVDGAIPVLVRALRAGRIPPRTWLQFFDSELAAEWVGAWDDTPPPPGIERE